MEDLNNVLTNQGFQGLARSLGLFKERLIDVVRKIERNLMTHNYLCVLIAGFSWAGHSQCSFYFNSEKSAWGEESLCHYNPRQVSRTLLPPDLSARGLAQA